MGRVRVKRHTRGPRGRKKGARPKVPGHTRKRPNPSSYPRYPGSRKRKK